MAEQPPQPPEEQHKLLETREELNAVTFEVLGAVHREILLLSYALDPKLYDSENCSRQLFNLIRRNRHCQIHILIADLNGLRRQGHHLLTLAQRFPSFITIRQQAVRYRSYRRECLITDARTVIYREDIEHSSGIYSQNDRRWAIELSHQFQNMWDIAEPHPDLRRLSI